VERERTSGSAAGSSPSTRRLARRAAQAMPSPTSRRWAQGARRARRGGRRRQSGASRRRRLGGRAWSSCGRGRRRAGVSVGACQEDRGRDAPVDALLQGLDVLCCGCAVPRAFEVVDLELELLRGAVRVSAGRRSRMGSGCRRGTHLDVPAAACEFGADGGSEFVVEGERALAVGELRDLVVVEVVELAGEGVSKVVQVRRKRARLRRVEWGWSPAWVGGVSRWRPVARGGARGGGQSSPVRVCRMAAHIGAAGGVSRDEREPEVRGGRRRRRRERAVASSLFTASRSPSDQPEPL